MPSHIDEDRQWQAKDDAMTLARAKEIINDSERHDRAKAAAVQMAGDAKEEFDNLKFIAGSKNPLRSRNKQNETDNLKPLSENRQSEGPFNVFRKIS